VACFEMACSNLASTVASVLRTLLSRRRFEVNGTFHANAVWESSVEFLK
jgi:hypothetical protein